jgi:hypothetical protein
MNMKRLTLLVTLCATAAVLLPVASASAFTGTCEIKGTATLNPALNAELKETTFNFASSGGKCEGTGAPTFEKATLEGEGNLSCAVSNGAIEVKGKVKGEGSITLSGKTDEISAFKFVAAAGVVKFTAKGPKVNAAGDATFLSNAESVTACAKGEAKALQFTAVTAGEFN